MATLITPDGTHSNIKPKNGAFTLEELQALVGGYIEHICLPQNHVAIVNEEGHYKQLPPNNAATHFLSRSFDRECVTVVGAMVVCGPEEFK